MSLGWGHDDGAFFFSCPDAAQQECCEAGFTLLCMGLFSRFFVQALPCTAEGTVCRVRDTRSLVPRAYGTNRSSSNTSCSGAGSACGDGGGRAKIDARASLGRSQFTAKLKPTSSVLEAPWIYPPVQTYIYVACLAACFYLTYRIAINWAKLRPRE